MPACHFITGLKFTLYSNENFNHFHNAGRQFITTLVLLLRSIISIGAANKCTDGSAVKDLIGFTLDGERVSNTKLEAVRWRRFEGLLAERGVRSLVGIADCGRLRGLRATRDIEAGETLLSMPRRLILDESHADSSDVAALWNASSLPAPPAFLKLALLVLHESRGGDEALLAPFVALMPTADDIAFEGGPAWMWSQEELALTECEKIVADAAAKRQTIDEMPIFSHTHLTPTWRQAKLPGEPPSREEILWAVAIVTTRWYAGNPLLVPIYDMANHALEPNARAGFDQEAGGGSADFKMVATRSIAQSDQVFVGATGGNRFLSSFQSLLLFGFVATREGAPSSLQGEVIFVRIAPLTANVEKAALEEQAEAGRLMRNRFGEIAALQPAGKGLVDALRGLRDANALPTKVFGVSATDAYQSLLQGTLDLFSTSLEEDEALLEREAEELPPRRRLALLFRVIQKRGLREALRALRGTVD